MSNLPPGASLSNEPGQYDPPDWAYILRLPSGDFHDFGWDYDSLYLRASGDESRITVAEWEL